MSGPAPANGPVVVGVDLGGTKIAAGLVEGSGRVVARVEHSTPVREGPGAVIQRMLEATREVCRAGGVDIASVRAVCVAAPGPLDPARGVVVHAPNLAWRQVAVVEPMERALGVPVFLENDANAAALGEWWAGAGRGTAHFLYVTVSTGIGGGIVIGGRLYRGAHAAAGEIGHTVIVVEDGPLCGCGHRGCLEAVASGTAIARRAVEALRGQASQPDGPGSILWRLAGGQPERIDARLVAEAARQGDALAQEVLEVTWRYLGAGLVNLMNLFDPEAIAIGGGVSRMGEMMMEPLRRYVRARAVAGPAEGTRLVTAQLGRNAGVVGAAAVARERLGLL